MKVICDRGALVESLSLVGGVVASRTPKPVLTCVKLIADADEASLTLSGTDLEVAIRLSTPRVDVQEGGEALIPADKLSQIVRESTDPTLTLETDGDVAHITGQDSKFRIFGYSASEFPPIPEFEGEPDYEISAAELHRLVAMTIFATARETSRYAINGVLFEREKNKLAVVATDGHRLALARGQCEAKNDEEARPAIVPTKALNLVLKLFDDAEQSVKVKVVENQILFASDEAVLSSNLIESKFPPYQDVIPKDGDKKATLSTDGFVSAVRRAALLTTEESKGVKLAFSGEGLTLSSRAPEMGEAEINLPVTEYQGDAVEIGFNPHYVLDALKVIDSEEVKVEMKAGNKPGLIRTGQNFLYVVMPINLQQ
jgi:DNA polymerase-3 subunit beta